MSIISVRNLRKTFKVKARDNKGVVSYFFPKMDELHSIKTLSFEIQSGERIAFIGPNGAGKSTTIKILTSILCPTAGEVQVLGLTPWLERKKLVRNIGVVFGQRSQLFFQLPVSDSLKLLASAYDIPRGEYQKRLGHLAEILEASEYLNRQVQQLSLGERMRCELIASLLHNPKILFLDEPTIGLDIISKNIVRRFIKQISETHDTTVMLTSHDTADMEMVCDRAIIINKGEMVLDMPIAEIRKRYLNKKIVSITAETENISLASSSNLQVLELRPFFTKVEVDTTRFKFDSVLKDITALPGITDLSIEDPSLEETISTIYRRGV